MPVNILFCIRSELITVWIVLTKCNFVDGSSACDDAKIRIWTIPEDGIDGTLTEPSSYLKGSWYFYQLYL